MSKIAKAPLNELYRAAPSSNGAVIVYFETFNKFYITPSLLIKPSLTGMHDITSNLNNICSCFNYNLHIDNLLWEIKYIIILCACFEFVNYLYYFS